MNTKHTPGAWEVTGSGMLGKGASEVTIRAVGFRLLVAKMPKNADAEANARLIAAAPDLLAACVVALEAETHISPEGWKVPYLDRNARVELLRAAIAKAEVR